MPLERLMDLTPNPPDPEELYTDLRFLSPPTARPTVVLNMVATLDGKTVLGHDGGWSTAIGSPTDRLLMRRIRLACPAIAVGAGTLRSGPTGFAPHLLRAIFTRSGKIPADHQVFEAGRERCIVFTPRESLESAQAQLRDVATVIGTGTGDQAITEALAILRRDFGIERLLLEGGPATNGAFLRTGCIDEVFLTIAPMVRGGSGLPGLFAGDPGPGLLHLGLSSAYRCQGEIYLRYRVQAPSEAPTKESLP